MPKAILSDGENPFGKFFYKFIKEFQSRKHFLFIFPTFFVQNQQRSPPPMEGSAVLFAGGLDRYFHSKPARTAATPGSPHTSKSAERSCSSQPTVSVCP